MFVLHSRLFYVRETGRWPHGPGLAGFRGDVKASRVPAMAASFSRRRRAISYRVCQALLQRPWSDSKPRPPA